ncbi:MAG: hypothetical protein ONB55_12870 [candidate division KSB1 bacterium]|nr:hypothetical protein [candidate division KSB1 bacterium]
MPVWGVFFELVAWLKLGAAKFACLKRTSVFSLTKIRSREKAFSRGSFAVRAECLCLMPMPAHVSSHENTLPQKSFFPWGFCCRGRTETAFHKRPSSFRVHPKSQTFLQFFAMAWPLPKKPGGGRLNFAPRLIPSAGSADLIATPDHARRGAWKIWQANVRSTPAGLHFTHTIPPGQQQASIQKSGSTTGIQPSVSGSNTNNPPVEAEIPRKKPFRGGLFSGRKAVTPSANGRISQPEPRDIRKKSCMASNGTTVGAL